MPLNKDTEKIQQKLGAYCQTGDESIFIEGTNKGRLPHYRRLVFNVIKDSLSSAYPLTKKLLGENRFNQLCLDFFSNHNCREPQIFRMTGELYDYIKNEDNSVLKTEYPFLEELLLFEWTEMDMYMMEDIESIAYQNTGDWLTDPIVMNPESRLLQFYYPVYRKKPNEISETDKALYYCFAYRQPKTSKIMFIDVSPLVAVVLSEISEGRTLFETFQTLQDSGLSVNSDIIEKIINFFKAEIKNGMFLGFNT